MQKQAFRGMIGLVLLGLVVGFLGSWYYGFICIGAAVIPGALWYFLWNRDQQAIRRNQIAREQAPMVQKQRSVPMSDERSKRIIPPGEL